LASKILVFCSCQIDKHTRMMRDCTPFTFAKDAVPVIFPKPIFDFHSTCPISWMDAWEGRPSTYFLPDMASRQTFQEEVLNCFKVSIAQQTEVLVDPFSVASSRMSRHGFAARNTRKRHITRIRLKEGNIFLFFNKYLTLNPLSQKQWVIVQ
jgi:hypothetical protein